MLFLLGKTSLFYVAIVLAIYASERLTPSSGDAALQRTIWVMGAAALVILGALAYAFYKAISGSPQWWPVIGLHVVLSAALLIWVTK